MHKKIVIKSIIKDFREIIEQYGFRYKKTLFQNLRKTLRSDEKAANDKNENDNEYLRGIIDRLDRLKKNYIKKDKYYDKSTKYWRIETIRYLFNNNNADCKLYLTNHQQYQSNSGKILLKPNEYLEKGRTYLIKLINNYCKI